jgi:hypothetical protein
MTQEQQDALERLRERVPEILEVFEAGKFPRRLMDATLLDTAICGVPEEAADDLRDMLAKLPMVPAMRGKAAEILDELVRVAATAAGG